MIACFLWRSFALLCIWWNPIRKVVLFHSLFQAMFCLTRHRCQWQANQKLLMEMQLGVLAKVFSLIYTVSNFSFSLSRIGYFLIIFIFFYFYLSQGFQQQQGIPGAWPVTPTTGLRPPVHGSSAQADGTQQSNQQKSGKPVLEEIPFWIVQKMVSRIYWIQSLKRQQLRRKIYFLCLHSFCLCINIFGKVKVIHYVFHFSMMFVFL